MVFLSESMCGHLGQTMEQRHKDRIRISYLSLCGSRFIFCPFSFSLHYFIVLQITDTKTSKQLLNLVLHNVFNLIAFREFIHS